MASLVIAAGNDRKFNWDDDDEDDFDLDTWKATVDTSSPNALDLGPLQLPPCEEKVENVVVNSLEFHAYEDAYWEAPDSDLKDMAVSDWPTVVSECECIPEPEVVEASAAYQDMLNMILEEQLAAARHEYLTHALGTYFEGKDEADAPAYPELSPFHGQRYRYAKAFQSIRYANGRRQEEVYRHSPLVFVTGIDDADSIDEEDYLDEYEEETLEDILGYEDELEELDMAQLDFTVTFEEEDWKGANKQVKLPRLPALEYFSQDEVKELVGMWKAQQHNDSEDCIEEEEEESSSSIDTWEKSDTDEEEPSELLEVEEHSEHLNTFPDIRPLEPKASTYNEELDFNEVVFCVDSDIESRDEGYISSSPPVSPVLNLLADGCEWQKEQTEAPTRPKRAVRVDSMDALDELGAAEE